MTSTSETEIELTASDGVRVAVWVDGSGPPLVLVHGSLQDHNASRMFVDELVQDFTTYAIDRRGFGASSDADRWAFDDDVGDLTMVVDEVASTTGRGVLVWGHSFGANVAMGAAASSNAVAGLILYEPSLGLPFADGSIEAVSDLLAAGDREGAVTHYLAEQLSEDDLTELRSTPRWQELIATAHTIPREALVERDWRYDGQFDSITAPTLMLTGSDTSPEVARATSAAADALGRPPEIQVLDGHGHFAHRTDPALVARIIGDFARSCTDPTPD